MDVATFALCTFEASIKGFYLCRVNFVTNPLIISLNQDLIPCAKFMRGFTFDWTAMAIQRIRLNKAPLSKDGAKLLSHGANFIKRDVAAGQFLESSLTDFLSYPFIVCLSEFAGDSIRASSSDSLRLTVRSYDSKRELCFSIFHNSCAE